MGPEVVFLVAGLCLGLAVVLPDLLSRWAVSPAIVLVTVGLLLGLTPLTDGLALSPETQRTTILYLTEITVLVALMGVGLAIDRPLSLLRPSTWGRWSAVWRMLGIAMPLSIAAVALLGWWAAGLAPAVAVLLGAVLAPTDPVLASDVQVGGPVVGDQAEEGADTDTDADPATSEERLEELELVDDEHSEPDEVRFALTAEAGLNDGLAFPFVYLALVMAAGPMTLAGVGRWTAWELLGKVLIGVGVGVALGWAIGKVAFRLRRESLRLAEQGEPLIALATLLTAYGVGELLGGYGFLSVFTCAMTLRAAERHHHYHRAMHEMVERLERLLTLVVLLFLGIASSNGLLDRLDRWGVLLALALVFVVRPLAGLAALVLLPRRRDAVGGLGRSEVPAVAFFGVRGVGSLYYLAYAADQHHFTEEPWLWSTVAFAIICSVLVHGIAATPVMRWLDRRRGWA